MDSKSTPSYQSIKSLLNICPFLGLVGDPETHYSFSHPANHCHRGDISFVVKLDYQGAFCLTENYHNCKVFTDSWQGELPPEIYDAQLKKPRLLPNRIMIFSFFVMVVAILFSLYLIGMNGSLTTRRLNIMTSSTPINLVLRIPTQTDIKPSSSMKEELNLPSMSSALPKPDPSASPTLVNTPTVKHTLQPATPTLGPDLKTPFGRDDKYLIYKISVGESSSQIAYQYDTTLEVIRAINRLPIDASIRPESIIVIIIGEDDPNNVLPLQAIFVEQEITIEELANQFGVSLQQILELNDLDATESIPPGRWVIIPMVNS